MFKYYRVVKSFNMPSICFEHTYMEGDVFTEEALFRIFSIELRFFLIENHFVEFVVSDVDPLKIRYGMED